MLDKLKLIEEVNKTCKLFFTESTFIIAPLTTNRFRLTGDNSSKGLNNFGNHSEEVTVIKWFSDYWVLIDIRFENNNTLISISIFQGEQGDNRKHQLFRAEWDDYNDINERHPQPHWHISANQTIEKTFIELANMDDKDNFVNLLQEEKSKIVDVNKIHFAMNGNWIVNKGHVNRIDENSQIVDWFQGLFACLKVQLEYIK